MMPLPSWFARVPYAWRYPGSYPAARRLARRFDRLDAAAQRAWLFARVRAIAVAAASDIPFYRNLYLSVGVAPARFRRFEDLAQLPIVTKSMLKAVPLEQRARRQVGAQPANTGGTSGEPLHFLLEPGSNGREWAGMLAIWERAGYTPADAKCTFRGVNLGAAAWRYDPRENQFLINTYRPLAAQADAVVEVAHRRPIRFLHGYPSALAAFARGALEADHPVLGLLRASLKGILLGSEYPAPPYRDAIERAFGAHTLSWYGHTERVVLAGERDRPFVYHPSQAYGWTEAVPGDSDDACRLIGTTLTNHVAPLIRYDTGDTVTPLDTTGGLLRAFRIASGRVGDVILDRLNQPISLTALIFGRHHPVFDLATHVQVRQARPGQATVLVTAPAGRLPPAPDWDLLFDRRDVALDLNFEIRPEPIRSAGGKTPLLVPPDPPAP